MKDFNMIFAGFGGHGILFVAKVVAYAGLMDGKEVSWLPSYGPEMCGGTCNCSVCLSDEPIGSPLVINPNVLVAMNTPSYDKFIDAVQPGGVVIVDSTLVTVSKERKDVRLIRIPATELADENGMKGLANIIILGRLFKETELCAFDSLEKGIAKSVPPRKQHLVEKNLEAIRLGQEQA